MRLMGYLVSQYPSTTHTFVLREIQELRRLGIEVRTISILHPDRRTDLMTPDEQDEAQSTFYVQGDTFVSSLQTHICAISAHPLQYLKGLFQIGALSKANLGKAASNLYHFGQAIIVGGWAEKNYIDHIHVHFSSGVAYYVGLVYGIGISNTLHGPGEFVDPDGFYLQEKVAQSDFTVVISKYGCSQVMRHCHQQHWHKIDVVPLGVDVSTFSPPQNAERRFGIRVELLCVARLVRLKGQYILLSVVRSLLTAGYNVRLTFVGDGPDQPNLKERAAALSISGHVRFLGSLNQDELISVYVASDIFTLATFAEGVPVVLMEAMAMGLPCVTTWVDGIPELITSGHEGVLVAPADVEAFAEAVRSLIRSPQLSQAIGANARRRVMHSFDLRNNVRVLARTILERVDASARTPDR